MCTKNVGNLGGAGRNRTDDLLLAKQALSQLSYGPHQNWWWARVDLNYRPHAYQACALTNWATGPHISEPWSCQWGRYENRPCCQRSPCTEYEINQVLSNKCPFEFNLKGYEDGVRAAQLGSWCKDRRTNCSAISLKGGDPAAGSPTATLLRLHPSRWPYRGRLPPKRLGYRLRVKPTPMVWRAVCTRPGNVFTVACWSTITSDSNFIFSSFREQSELR